MSRGFYLLTAASCTLGALSVLMHSPAPQPLQAHQQSAPTASLYDYLPRDAMLVIHVDLDQLWKHPGVQRYSDNNAGWVAKISESFYQALAIRPFDLRSVAFYMRPSKSSDDRTELFEFGLLIRSQHLWTAEHIKKLRTAKDDVRVVELDAYTLALVDKRPAQGGQQFLPRANNKKGPLQEPLQAAAQQHPFVFVAFLPERLPAEMMGALQNGDSTEQLIAELLKSTRIATMTVTLEPVVNINLQLQATHAEVVATHAKNLQKLRELLLQSLTMQMQSMEADLPERRDILPIHTCLQAFLEAAQKSELSTRGSMVQLQLRWDARELPLAAAFASGVQQVRASALEMSNVNNLKQIGLALHCYHDVLGHFPPVAQTNKNGKPLLSWRVLILPYIEQDALYRQFRLDEPWDSEHNAKLIPQIPKLYVLPGMEETDGKKGLTRYRVFVGNGAAWEPNKALTLQQFRDGTSNTWLVVVAKDAVPWTKPEELPFDPKKDPSVLLGKVVNRWQALFSDGAVRSYQKLPKADIVRGLITRDGGEVIPPDKD